MVRIKSNHSIFSMIQAYMLLLLRGILLAHLKSHLSTSQPNHLQFSKVETILLKLLLRHAEIAVAHTLQLSNEQLHVLDASFALPLQQEQLFNTREQLSQLSAVIKQTTL
jgi:hypothetical protein